MLVLLLEEDEEELALIMLMEMAGGGVVVTVVLASKDEDITTPSPRVCNAIQKYRSFSGATLFFVCCASLFLQLLLIPTNDRAER